MPRTKSKSKTQARPQQFQSGDSYINLVVGVIVVIAIAAVVVGLIRSKAVPSIGQQAQQTEQAQGTDAQVALPTKHTVAAGETLWTISEKYYKTGYNWTDIAAENKLENPGVIEEGTELTIPKVEAKVQDQEATDSAAMAPPEATPTPTEAPVAQAPQVEQPGAISGNSYTVASGDNLWDIAVRAYGDGYRWVDIARANNLVNPNLIHPGNQFTLPR